MVPVRRVCIEKKNSTKKRPLGMPTWSDKLLQEVIRMILDAYYEPQFSVHSHGFRPNRGCGTAVEEIHREWNGTAWFLEGDITSYFDTIDHTVMVEILRMNIHDNRLLRLIESLLRAGYLEGWKYNATLSGTPQGGVVSPILSNIDLDMLDQYVEQYLTPAYNRGERRGPNPAYRKLTDRVSKVRRRGGDREEVKRLAKKARQLPSVDPVDPNFRRLRYVRYADDVRHITRRSIPFAERRGSEGETSGSTAYPAAKAKRDRSMPLKRGWSEDADGRAPRDPRDTVKARLLEPESPAMQAYIPRAQRLRRGRRDRATKSSSLETSAWRAVSSERTQGDGPGTYVALETSSTVGMWDHPPRREAQGDGAAVVLRGRESRPPGEGRQVL
jgi:retron-type reverse transcriptase